MYEIKQPIRWTKDSTNFIVLGWHDETEDGAALKNVITGDYPEDATVTVTVKDRYGENITGAIDLAMTHVVGTTGEDTQYIAQVPHTVTLEVGKYVAIATAIKSGVQKKLKKEIIVDAG